MAVKLSRQQQKTPQPRWTVIEPVQRPLTRNDRSTGKTRADWHHSCLPAKHLRSKTTVIFSILLIEDEFEICQGVILYSQGNRLLTSNLSVGIATLLLALLHGADTCSNLIIISMCRLTQYSFSKEAKRRWR